MQGQPANNVLLTGARGTGKSSLIKACLNEFAADGLRLIEVDKADLVDLPDIVDLVGGRPENASSSFATTCRFEEGESGYKALKVGARRRIAAQSDNVLIYATSNRRHLMPERMSDNASYTHADDGDLHPGETVEEKISLSERFGLWVSFYPFKQDDYLDIVAHWLRHFGCVRPRSRPPGPTRCAGRCSAARARAALRGSSPRIMPAACVKPWFVAGKRHFRPSRRYPPDLYTPYSIF